MLLARPETRDLDRGSVTGHSETMLGMDLAGFGMINALPGHEHNCALKAAAEISRSEQDISALARCISHPFTL